MGDQGLQKGRLLPKPKARMDAYHVGRNMFSFVASSIDMPLRACEVREHDMLSLPLSIIQRFEQDARVLTMVGSFLDLLRLFRHHIDSYSMKVYRKAPVGS